MNSGGDVTERRRNDDALRATEELNRMILASVPAGIVQVDRAGRIVSANLLARQFLGFTFEELTQRTIEDFRHVTCHEDGTPCPVEEYPAAKCLATNRPQPAMTIGVTQRDGGVRWAMFSAVPLTDPQSEECRGAVVTFLDITERKQTEEHARQLQHELAHVARLTTMGEMASGMAHELNQPLAAIIAYADACHEMIESGRMASAQVAEVLRSVSAQAERAGKIIQRLRKLVKKSEPVRSPIRINDAVREVAALLESDTRRAGVALRLELDEQAPPVVADFVQIQQVLLNLMRNGLEAMAQCAAPNCELIVGTRPTAEGMVEVSISDCGRGVDVETVDHLFEPFFTTKVDGLGMGLSISRSIVEAHGGRLGLTPNSGQGMTARFFLPIGDGRLNHVSGTHRLHRG